MGRKKLPTEKRRIQVNITIPSHLVSEIDHIKTKCNRSELYEQLLRKGYAVWAYQKSDPDAVIKEI